MTVWNMPNESSDDSEVLFKNVSKETGTKHAKGRHKKKRKRNEGRRLLQDLGPVLPVTHVRGSACRGLTEIHEQPLELRVGHRKNLTCVATELDTMSDVSECSDVLLHPACSVAKEPERDHKFNWTRECRVTLQRLLIDETNHDSQPVVQGMSKPASRYSDGSAKRCRRKLPVHKKKRENQSPDKELSNNSLREWQRHRGITSDGDESDSSSCSEVLMHAVKPVPVESGQTSYKSFSDLFDSPECHSTAGFLTPKSRHARAGSSCDLFDSPECHSTAGFLTPESRHARAGSSCSSDRSPLTCEQPPSPSSAVKTEPPWETNNNEVDSSMIPILSNVAWESSTTIQIKVEPTDLEFDESLCQACGGVKVEDQGYKQEPAGVPAATLPNAIGAIHFHQGSSQEGHSRHSSRSPSRKKTCRM